MKVEIEINTGNDAMLTGEQVAEALVDAAYEVIKPVNSGMEATKPIRDDNGNTVGRWAVSKENT